MRFRGGGIGHLNMRRFDKRLLSERHTTRKAVFEQMGYSSEFEYSDSDEDGEVKDEGMGEEYAEGMDEDADGHAADEDSGDSEDNRNSAEDEDDQEDGEGEETTRRFSEEETERQVESKLWQVPRRGNHG